MQKVVVSAENETNGVDTNEAAGMSSVISHPAGAICSGAAPFSILCTIGPADIAPLWRPLATLLHPLVIRETRNRFFDNNSPRL